MTTRTEKAPAEGRRLSERRSNRIKTLGYRYGIIVAWIAVVVIFGAIEPSVFLTTRNFASIFSGQSAALVLALALIPTLIVGEFDLSVAGVLGLSATTVGVLNGLDHWNLLLAVLIGLLVGVVVGIINGYLVVVLGVNSLITTLGMATLLLGVSTLISGNSTVGGVGGWLGSAVNASLGGISVSLVYALVVVFALWYVARHTPLGRYAMFIGRNSEVARLAGIRVDRIRFGSFVLGGLLSALAGIILIGVDGGLEPASTAGMLLPALTAVFLGATAIEPGRFNAWGTTIGTFFLATGIVGIEFTGASGWVVSVFDGAILIVAVTLSTVVGRGLEG
jgi:ribose transport system permease protein